MRCRRELKAPVGTVLLCDADGNLFPSELPAFEAATVVANRLLRRLGSTERWTTESMRSRSLGRNFRSLAAELSQLTGTPLDDEELDTWVEEENQAVMTRLAGTLRPDPAILSIVRRLAGTYRMAVVSSSKLNRLAVCLTATGLAPYFPTELRFSAHDSLSPPTSKPDPAVYRHALRETRAMPGDAIAVEDAVAGVASAVAAGIPTIGNLVFVPLPERRAHGEALLAAGASMVIEDWSELETLLSTAVDSVVTGEA
jgi:beta-phosphoglucomutase-like phosphatase (HAD superfamily)